MSNLHQKILRMRPKALLFLCTLLLFQAFQSLQAQNPSLAEYRWTNFGISFKLPKSFKVAHSSEQDFLAANEQVSLEIHAFSGNIGSAKALAQKSYELFPFQKKRQTDQESFATDVFEAHYISGFGLHPKTGQDSQFFCLGVKDTESSRHFYIYVYYAVVSDSQNVDVIFDLAESLRRLPK
jgi:hypothetical protein